MNVAGGKIVVVDDSIVILNFAKAMLNDKFDVLTASSGASLFQILEDTMPDLILLDIEMPEMNGYDVIVKLKREIKTASIPVIFLTSKISLADQEKGLNLGAVDFIAKPFSPELLLQRVNLHLLLEKQKEELRRYSHTLEVKVEQQSRTLLELQNTILKAVVELVEHRDSVTGGHIDRTQQYLRRLVDFLVMHGVYEEELSKWDIDLFVMSSQLHDVGKISIKDRILMKPGPLTEKEFEEMKNHCALGVDIITRIAGSTTQNAFLEYAKTLAGTHHEKWDGNGYPYGLHGDGIPLQGRLMAIVDVYDALTNERPYKKAFSHEESVEIIRQESGTHFDPKVADIFLLHEKEFNPAAFEPQDPVFGFGQPQKAADDCAMFTMEWRWETESQ